MKTYYRIFIITGLLLLTACGSQKRIADTGKGRTREGRLTIEHVLQAQPQFGSAQAGKIRVSINYAERKVNAGGTIRILTDSAIVLSVQPLLGIELFRVEITPRTVTVIDKMNRRYVRTDYAGLQQHTGLPVTYRDIQALCMNRLCVLGCSEQEIRELRPIVTDNADSRQLSFDAGNLHYVYTTDRQTDRITEARFQPKDSRTTSVVRYLDYEQTDGVLFPCTIEIGLLSDLRNGTCTISMSRLQFNGEVNVAPLNTERYSPVSMKTLLP